MRRVVTGLLNQASTQFSDAVRDYQDAYHRFNIDTLKSEDKLELGSCLIQIGLGAFTPGLGTAIGALILPLAEFVKELNVPSIYINELESLKMSEVEALLDSAVRPMLWGESDWDAVFIGLTMKFSNQVIEVISRLSEYSDAQLGVLYAIAHPNVSNRESYRRVLLDILNKYQNELRPIGRVSRFGRTKNFVCWVHREKPVGPSNWGRLTLVQGPSNIMDNDILHSIRGPDGVGEWKHHDCDEPFYDYKYISNERGVYGSGPVLDTTLRFSFLADISEEMTDHAIAKTTRILSCDQHYQCPGIAPLSIPEGQVRNYPGYLIIFDELLFEPYD